MGRGNRRLTDGMDDRRRMIAEHNAYLTWALGEESGRVSRREPRIPRRRADRGGFADLLRLPGARAAVEHWWDRVLSMRDSTR